MRLAGVLWTTDAFPQITLDFGCVVADLKLHNSLTFKADRKSLFPLPFNDSPSNDIPLESDRDRTAAGNKQESDFNLVPDLPQRFQIIVSQHPPFPVLLTFLFVGENESLKDIRFSLR